jgi:opacity protein-like surface antigen
MKQRHSSRTTRGICAIAITVSSVMLAVPNTYPETYIAGQLGFALPSLAGGLSDGDINSSFFLPGTTHGEFELSTSFMFGGKVGHYFNAARWIGLEAEVFHATPHIDQQVHTFQNPSLPGVSASATFQGGYFRVLTVAPFNLMFRYPMTRLQPYIGVGPGIFFARIKGEGLAPDSPESTSDNARLGLNAKAGLEYYVTKHLTAFAEWKFNYAHFKFDENLNLFPFPYGLETTYTMHLVSFGVGYHF